MALSALNNWRLLSEGSSSGANNMALDYAFTQVHHESNILRLYGWHPRAISIGFHQSTNIVDINKCKNEGIDLVRRPTGGRAILHDNEITYSLILRGNEFDFEEIYLKVHVAIAAAILKIGIKVELVNANPSKGQLSPGSGKFACFTSTAKTELEYDGKKIVGSAGRQYALLIHGSILLGSEHKEIIKFLNLTEKKQKALKFSLDSKTADLATILGEQVNSNLMVEYLTRSFSQIFKAEFKDYEISGKLLNIVNDNKYKFDLSNNPSDAVAA